MNNFSMQTMPSFDFSASSEQPKQVMNSDSHAAMFAPAPYGHQVGNPGAEPLSAGAALPSGSPHNESLPPGLSRVQSVPVFSGADHGAAKLDNSKPSMHRNNTPVMPQKMPQNNSGQRERPVQVQQRIQLRQSQDGNPQEQKAGDVQKASQDQNQQQSPLQQLPRQVSQSSQQLQPQNLQPPPNKSPLSSVSNGSNATPWNANANASPQSLALQAGGPSVLSSASQQDAMNVKIFRRNFGNASIVRILDMVDQISNTSREALSTLAFWVRVCQVNFRPTSFIKLTIGEGISEKFASNSLLGSLAGSPDHSRVYSLDVNTAPRFFLASVLTNNVKKHHVTLTGFKYQIFNNGTILLVCHSAVTFHFDDDSSGVSSGMCRFFVSRDLLIQSIEYKITDYQRHLSLDVLENKMRASNTKEGISPSTTSIDVIQKTMKDARCSQKADNLGFSNDAIRLMKIGDVMSHLRRLMQFSLGGNLNSPLKALDVYINSNSSQQQGQVSGGFPTDVSSPSPRTQVDEGKVTKKQKTLSSAQSPANSEPRRT